jgi:ubiquinol-cytochrome c reductase cytochrome b subunit
MLKRAASWFSDRLGLRPIVRTVLHHPVPPSTTRGVRGWLYVLGFVTAAALIVQVITGIALTSRYIPATAAAYESVQILSGEFWGGLIRGMHYWGASALVLFMLLHMLRSFVMGAYKFPREMLWITGVLLFGFVMVMAFTGQLLRWDQDGLWGSVVASQYAARVPLIGDALKRFILAGDSVSGATLGRYFSLHVVMLPLLLFALLGVHMYLVVHHGISERARPGEPVDPATYREKYKRFLEREGLPYWPHATWSEIIAAAVMVAGVITLALLVGGRSLGEPPDPASVPSHPRPDWYLMWYYALLAIKPRGFEDLVMVYLPIIALVVLVLLPIVRSKGERAPSRRPIAMAAAGLVAFAFVGLTITGYREPWVPRLETPVLTAQELGADTPPEVLAGARVFHEAGCQFCHAVVGTGGSWGPDLTDVRARLSEPVLVDRILNGVGDMPGYRGTLSAEQLEEILAFLDAIGARQP